MATIVVAIKPMTTGIRFLRANSKGLTLQMAAAGMSAHGMSTPPPTQIAAIWPRAVKVAVPPPMAVPNRLATDPAKEMPEKPEPSKPVMAPRSSR